MNNQINQAIKILNQGGIVIFPTDTAFGISCRMDNEKTIQRLFKIRQRPLTQATPVLVSGLEMAQEYLLPIPPDVKENLIKKYWPGALTIVLPSLTQKIPALVRGNSKNLGVRMPNHQIPLQLISQTNVPLLAPSANIHSRPTPYTFASLDVNLAKQVDFIIPGNCTLKNASTVIDCSITPWKILRHGAVSI